MFILFLICSLIPRVLPHCGDCGNSRHATGPYSNMNQGPCTGLWFIMNIKFSEVQDILGPLDTKVGLLKWVKRVGIFQLNIANVLNEAWKHEWISATNGELVPCLGSNSRHINIELHTNKTLTLSKPGLSRDTTQSMMLSETVLNIKVSCVTKRLYVSLD